MIRIIGSLFMVAGLMLFSVGVNEALQSPSKGTHMGWRAKTENISQPEGGKTLLGRFIASFRDVVNAEKAPRPRATFSTCSTGVGGTRPLLIWDIESIRRATSPYDCRHGRNSISDKRPLRK